MKRLSFAALAISALVLVFAACGEKKFRGYKQTKTGLYYKITTKNDKGKMPQQGDYLLLDVSFDADFDTTIVMPEREMESLLEAPRFQGDLFEAYSLLKEGEEGEFYIKADSFMMYFLGVMPPPTVKPESMLHFKIKIKEVKPKEKFEAEMAVKRKEYEEMLEQKKEEEKTALTSYLSEKKVTVKPTASGLYYIETTNRPKRVCTTKSPPKTTRGKCLNKEIICCWNCRLTQILIQRSFFLLRKCRKE